MATQVPTREELPNKPLAEAIFELRWRLQAVDERTQIDPGYRILLGRYYDQVRHYYKAAVDLPTSQVPEAFTPHQLRHQFRHSDKGWPLTQIGPGIITVNDTEGYTWDDFSPLVSSAIDALFDSYPSDIRELEPLGMQLRYINAVPYDPMTQTPPAFLRDYLHTKVEIDELLFEEQPDRANSPEELNLNFTYPLPNLPGLGMIGFSTGKRENVPSIIWEIKIRSLIDNGYDTPDAIKAWVASAHGYVNKWFFALCRGELLESFRRGSA